METRPSPIHGKGLFVTRDVKPGELLTLYPPDILTFRRTSPNSDGSYGLAMRYGAPLDNARSQAELHEIIQTYSFHLGTTGGVRAEVVGFPDLCDQPAYLAHIANDGVGPSGSADQYNKNIVATCNASLARIYCRMCVGIFAVSPIPTGTEVLVPYTFDYWDQRQ